MAKKATYTVKLAKNFTHPTHMRGGLLFERNVSQVLELTAKEAEVYANDRYMEITEGEAESQSSNAGSSETGTPDGNDQGAGTPAPTGDDEENDDENEGQGSSKTQTPEGGDTPSPEEVKAKLLQKKRAKVDKLAAEAGVESPEKLPNKEAVVDAYLATQTQGE